MKNIVRKLRLQFNMTQDMLAKMIGITRPALSEIENGKVVPNGKIVIRLANIFKLPAEQIFFEDDVIREEHTEQMV